MKQVRGGVTAPGGFLASGIPCGIKRDGRRDLSLMFSQVPARWTALLTTNRAPAAPVLLTRKLLRGRRTLQAVVVNSGNANSATGAAGLRAAESIAADTARLLGLDRRAVVMSSTGIIGEPLPQERIRTALPLLADGLSRSGGGAAAEGILTTDTFVKERAVELSIPGRGSIRIGGMAKGAGMICPSMATMLAFVTTDAVVSSAHLRSALRDAADETFNRITVDGDSSTNDTVLLMANGASGVRIDSRDPSGRLFRRGLREVCQQLAEMIVRDAEGATKFVEVRVSGARSGADALRAAMAVADSNLVKTAWFGNDLNWGRIVAALGSSGAAIEPEKISIAVNGCVAVRRGRAVPPRVLARARRQMRNRKLVFAIELGLGKGRERVLTCDLSLDYVRENALYST